MFESRIPPEIRTSQEFQSAVIRLSIWAFMVPMLGLSGYFGEYDFTWQQFALLFGVHLAWYGGILISVLKRPGLWRGRTYISILADLSGTTGAIYLTGDSTVPFYLLYAVSFLSQGMRYGAFNLLLASLCSLLAFTMVAAILGDWQAQTLEVSFIALVLVVLPAYEYNLLRKLQNAKQAAETANQARGDFLATMTHELRTPLSGVIGMAGLLNRTRLDSEQREYVDSINTSAGVLQGLIGDILDLSKIDAGKLELKPVSFELRETLSETCWALSNQSLDKGVELICRVAPDLPQQVYGDPLRFRQILFNLIGNAVKFTDSGHIHVDARAVPAADGFTKPYLQIQISDTGIGIPADRVDHVFDSFWQADHSSTRRHGGTGLGTAISRDLVALMGGTIGVESVEDEGSTFTVKLPLLGHVETAPPSPPEGLRGRDVVVLEPQSHSAEAIAELCEAAEMSAHVVSGIDRLGALARDDVKTSERLALIADGPCAIDLEQTGALVRKLLGERTSLLYLRYPRRKPANAEVTATSVFKPVDAQQLWRAMADCLRPVIAADTGDDLTMPPLPAGGGRVLVAEDDDINAKLITKLLGQVGCQVTLAKDGQAALTAATETAFDLAFVDLRMPHMDGIDFTKAYRAQEESGRHLPIVALTANAAEETRAACLRAGMDEFVAKPVDPQVLSELILRYGVDCKPD